MRYVDKISTNKILPTIMFFGENNQIVLQVQRLEKKLNQFKKYTKDERIISVTLQSTKRPLPTRITYIQHIVNALLSFQAMSF